MVERQETMVGTSGPRKNGRNYGERQETMVRGKKLW